MAISDGELVYNPDIPVIPCGIDWAGGVLERFEWYTRVLRSESGLEQRQGLRIAPRRSIEFTMQALRGERLTIDNILTTHQTVVHDEPGLYYVPLWHHGVALDRDYISGAAAITVPNLRAYSFAFGHPVLVYDPFNRSSRVDICSGANTGTNVLSIPFNDDTPARCVIIPLVMGRFDGNPKFNQKNPRLFEAQVRFTVWERDAFAALDYGPAYGAAWGTRHIASIEPETSEDMTAEYERIYLEVDNRKSLPTYSEVTERSSQIVYQHYRLSGSTEYLKFKDLLYSMAGRKRGYYFPSFMQDMELAENANNTMQLKVLTCGLKAGLTYPPERSMLHILRNDGVEQATTIVAVANNFGYDTITLDRPVTAGLDNIQRISFLSYMRQEQDTIEVKHMSDLAGTADVALTLRNAVDSVY